MKLYDLAWGPWTRRVTIYLKEKGITDIEIVSLKYGDEKSPELLEKNPLGFLPFLELDDGTVLVDSIAIMEYLEELYPDPVFVGQNACERNRFRSYLNLVNEFFLRALPIYVNRIPQFSQVLTQSPETADWLQPFFDKTIECMEFLADDEGPFLMGKQISIVDCALYPMVHHNAENFDIETFPAKYPKLHRWAEMFAKRPSAPCPLRDDGLREKDGPPPPPAGKDYWWKDRFSKQTSSSG